MRKSWRVMAIVGAAMAAAAGAPIQAKPMVVAHAVTQKQAEALANATEATWTSMDAARIKALYGPGIVGFDVAAPGLSTSKSNWDALQDAYVALKIDGSLRKVRTIQLIGSDAFLVSGFWHITSSLVPANSTDLRCTDLYQRFAGKWLIVNEHCSVPLKT